MADEMETADYFALLGVVPARLELDEAALEREFYAKSRKLHPDRFAAKGAEEQARALAVSAVLNDAYRTLRDPIGRTQYVLEQEGVQTEEESQELTRAARGGGGAKKQMAPPELLEEAFELNMQLEEMRMAKGSGEEDAELRRELEGARARYEGMLKETGVELEGMWRRWDGAMEIGDAAGRAAAVQAMVGLLQRRSYVRNLVRDVHEALA